LSLGRGFATSRVHLENNSVTRLIDRCRSTEDVPISRKPQVGRS